MKSRALIRMVLILSTNILLLSSSAQETYLDEFKLEVPTVLEVDRPENDENVQLILSIDQELMIMVQNKVNILVDNIFKHTKDEQLMESLHRLKFRNYVKEMDGYDVGETTLDTVNNVIFTQQRFTSVLSEIESFHDLRIVKIGGNYYPFYSLGKQESEKAYRDLIDQVVFSLSRK